MEISTVSFEVLTVYPELFSAFLSQGLISKAIKNHKLEVELVDYRKHGVGKHRKVDDTPYGGGAGMVLRPEPIVLALEEKAVSSKNQSTYKVLLSPQGKKYCQQKAIELSQIQRPITLICGRFEGFDERIRSFVDDEISLGDFILMGGEIAAMAIIESVGRLIPGVIGNENSLSEESFSQSLLEYSQYTRPLIFRGLKVPEVLTSGNHKEIENWRKEDSIKKTKEKRSDLFQQFSRKSSEE